MKILFILPLLLIGCLSKPDVQPDNPCGVYLHCLYYMQKAPDKSACAPLASACRNTQRYEYCRDKKNQVDDFDDCMKTLNQI